MEYYVGLVVGLEETSLCNVDSEGKTVREVKVSTEPAAIRSALEGFADRLSRVEGTHGPTWRMQTAYAMTGGLCPQRVQREKVNAHV